MKLRMLQLCLVWLCILPTAQAQKMPFPQYNGEKFALLDAQTFKPLTPYKYESIGTFKDGLALSTSRSEAGKLQYSFLNPQGKEVIAPTPNRMYEFSEGKARIKNGDRFGYIDTQGKAILPASYVKAQDYREGRFVVKDADLRVMIIDEKGNLLQRFDSDINYIRDYREGLILAGVHENEEMGDAVDEPYNRITGEFNFYDKQGKKVIDLKKINEKINYASDFKNGVAIVGFFNRAYEPENPTVYGLIDHKGTLILPMIYNFVEFDKAGYIKLQTYSQSTYQNFYGLADNKGKILMRCEYTMIFDPIGEYRLFQKKVENPNEMEQFPDRYGIARLNGDILIEANHKDIYLHRSGDFMTLDSLVTIDKTDYQQTTNLYSYHTAAGKTIHRSQEMRVYNNYFEILEGDNVSDGHEYRVGDVPFEYADKLALLNLEKHELHTKLVDDIAPFRTIVKGDKVAIREGKNWLYLDENFERTPQTYEGASNFGENEYATVKKGGKWAVINKMGVEVTPYAFDSIVPNVTRIKFNKASNEFSAMYGADLLYEVLRSSFLPSGNFVAQKNKMWGIINWDGQVILPFQYEQIQDAFYNYVIISKAGKLGIVDFAGKELVPAKYSNIKVVNDLAYVRENGKEGLLDLQNNVVVPAEYDTIFEPNQNFIKVVKGKKIGYLTYQGKEVLPAVYDAVNLYNPQYQLFITVVKDGKMGVVNSEFKPLLPCEYDSVFAETYQKYIWVKKNGLQGLLDDKGKVVVPIQYQYIDNLEKDNYSNNPRILLAQLKNKWGILDTIGKPIIPFEYDYMKLDYSRQRVVIGKKNKFGMMRSDGKIVIPIKYDELGTVEYQNHLMGIKKKGKWGFINSAGKEVIPATFDDAKAFAQTSNEQNNLLYFAIVKKGKYWGIINEAGKAVVPFAFDQIDYIPYNTLQPIQVTRNGVSESINFKGEPYTGE